jgi:hypothetical protein
MAPLVVRGARAGRRGIGRPSWWGGGRRPAARPRRRGCAASGCRCRRGRRCRLPARPGRRSGRLRRSRRLGRRCLCGRRIARGVGPWGDPSCAVRRGPPAVSTHASVEAGVRLGEGETEAHQRGCRNLTAVLLGP